ncbi:MAG: F0F1 ATP synthase subunit B [Spirochaetaceae bacterium]|jgi:F-type H+-transporting ATPase subunit b|nr:F0F1 ATP synthase subunit B [Spirochaetaceae bacterium]
MIDPSITTFLITLINIGILYFVLRKILFKPVTQFMEGRTKKIEDTIAQAEQDKDQAKRLLERYEAQLKQAGEEAERIIKAARETARHEADSLVARGKEAAEQLLANGRKQLEAERHTALALFRAEAAAMVVNASGRLLRRDLQSEDNRRYADLLLQELGRD